MQHLSAAALPAADCGGWPSLSVCNIVEYPYNADKEYCQAIFCFYSVTEQTNASRLFLKSLINSGEFGLVILLESGTDTSLPATTSSTFFMKNTVNDWYTFTFCYTETAIGGLSGLGNRSENSAGRGQVLSIMPGNSCSITQKSDEIWTVQTDLQQIYPKSDRLLGE